ncbi:MAG: outer membrane beta-barrel protein [Candidatus Jettenia sp. CY-1]|nr:MAG: outer membrane beta-barrel protein [Candidatus Jettenia sp. CY-1]
MLKNFKYFLTLNKTILCMKLFFSLSGILFLWIPCCEVNAQYTIPPGLTNLTDTRGNIHWGPLKIHPLFTLSEAFDDNIFDTPTKEESDFITIYSPGLNLFLPIKGLKSELNMSYLANFLEYRENPEQDHIDQYIEGSFKTIFPLGLSITLNNRFEDTELPPTFDYILGELIQRTKRKSNYFTTTIALPDYFANFDPELYYSNSDNQYEEFKDSSYNEQKIGARLTYKLFTKLSTLAEFNIGKTTYDTGVLSDSIFYESLVGIQFKGTAKTTGTFKVGYRIRDYEDKEVDQFSGVILSLEAETRLNALTSISILLRRSQEEVLFTQHGNFYELNSIYLTFRRKLTKKLEGSISNYYQVLDFPAFDSEPSTEFFTWGLNTSLSYMIQKWLFTELSYWYEDRDSSSDNSEELGRKKNVITFTIGATF